MPRAWHALAGYLVITLATTWPLARGLGRDVAWDLGDSILNMWILAWDAEQIRGILGGDVSRIATFFDANIFYPVPLTLAYSEHLIPQALQAFPVYVVSGNPILCYNLLFLSTFVLSGLGMYLLVRELTGNGYAAFVAGLLFAFAPYRLAQSTHLQVLSSQWMPFVFYGLLRYFTTRRRRPLAGAALALTAQSLSSGYYLLFFPPFVAAFALWQIGSRKAGRDRRLWLELPCAGLLAAVLSVPFLLPYATFRAEGSAYRSLAEVSRFSADVYSYATAFPEQRVWGGVLRAFPKPEGELFPGAVPVLLALAGLMLWASPTALAPQASRRRQWLAWLFAALAIGHGVAAVCTIALRRISIDTGWFIVRMGNVNQLLLRALIALLLLMIVSPAARARIRAFLRTRGFFVLALLAALWLSLGPLPQSLGRPVEIASPYRVLFEQVPGFDGARVPARFAMIVAFMLAVLAGYGADALMRWRYGRAVLLVASAAFLLEATHVPFTLNGMTPVRGFNSPEARLYRPARAPAVYHEMARQPPTSVVVELPLGPPDFDLRAMYYSIVHWRPLVNGYSGFTPPHYGRLISALSEIPRHPELSLEALRATRATHVILHESAYVDGEGPRTAALLREAGAVELFRDGSDLLFQLQP